MSDPGPNEGENRPRMDGADPAVVSEAISTGDPLPGTAGFAGRVDGALVRDVLGRRPLFVERGVDHPTGASAWSHARETLADPAPVPAGHAVDAEGERRLWSLPTVDPADDLDSAVDGDHDAIEERVDAVDTSGLAIAFSGGVDSSLLAARLDAPLYVAGFPESQDVEVARATADLLGRPIEVVPIDHDLLESVVPRVARATGRKNAMDVAIAVPLFLTAERAVAECYDRLAVGQGVDELFGGYAKVANAPDDHRVEADSFRGARREVLASLPDQLERDVLAIRAAGAEPVAPYLHDRVVRAALALPGDGIVDAAGTRKVAFREAARASLPDQVATRDKKAMQYGSLVARELDRLARQAGFKRRMDDHVTQYVESLLV
jgi:asparagine synthase (glutamine-hydrolysing)